MPDLPIPYLTAAEVRRRYVEFFVQRGHTEVPSASLVPAGDQTLLFTNSGMVQFKDVLTGREKRSYVRATDYQRCLRVAGKHNDFEEVGRTPRHHTFFEMLGNWSFGDYFKRDAIHWAWELLTEVYKIPADRLAPPSTRTTTRPTTSGATRSAAAGADRPLGQRREGRRRQLLADGGDGAVRPLLRDPLRPRAGVQRGAALRPGPLRALPALARGLEPGLHGVRAARRRHARAAADEVRGHRHGPGAADQRHPAGPTNYDTDLFTPIHAAMRDLLGHDPEAFEAERFSYQVIADHSRAVTFLVADGVAPSNEGRGYVLRRILRRAVRHGRLLGRASRSWT
jgi:alanyl-tRNA synthetase